MRYTISKEFGFSASHQLLGLPADHPCSRLHGHNYVVRIEISAETLTEVGFIIDYRELDLFKQYLDAEFDHRDLNSVLPKGLNPTAECLARRFYFVAIEIIRGMRKDVKLAVSVSETPKTWATYRGEQ